MIQRKHQPHTEQEQLHRPNSDSDRNYSDEGRDGDYNKVSTEDRSREEGDEDYDDELEEAYDDEVRDEDNSYVSYDGNSNNNEPDR